MWLLELSIADLDSIKIHVGVVALAKGKISLVVDLLSQLLLLPLSSLHVAVASMDRVTLILCMY